MMVGKKERGSKMKREGQMKDDRRGRQWTSERDRLRKAAIERERRDKKILGGGKSSRVEKE